MGTSGSLNVLECHHLAGVFLAHRAAEEAVAVEESDLGQVAGIIADDDRLADEACERRGNIAQSLEADAVAPYAAWFGMQDQQEVEIFKAVGQARQEALATPSVERRLTNLAVNTGVIGAGDEGADLAVELRQRQRWG